jgi:formylglycine-generating enzyme required for sulfatase activity/serine/threonine protein kinase
MSSQSPAAFLETLRDSRLLPPEDVERLIAEQPERFADAQALGQELLRRGLLTSYQLEALLGGNGAGLVLGPYRLLARLGRGGMGEVFKARHERLDRLAAIKLIRGDYLARPEAVVRFQREARAAARLQHPNVVTVYDAGQEGETHFIAMEYVEGTDLGQLVRQGVPLPAGQACEYVRQAALGLQHAHEQGLIHRDIKPSNLVVTRGRAGEPVVKVLDFGLARFVSELGEETALTPDDAWLGTPDYIAPEQARDSRSADIRADIFSLGCTLFYLLTGHPAYPGSNRTEKLAARLSGEATPVQSVQPGVPPKLAAVLRRMLARDPADRYQTPGEVAQALAPFARPGAADIAPAPAAADGTASTLTGSVSALSPDPASTGPMSRPPRLRRRLLAAGLLALGLALALLALHRFWPGAGPAPTPPDRRTETSGPLVNSIGMALAPIHGGTFRIGSPPTEAGRAMPGGAEDEGPQCEVQVRPFYLGAYEVTQAEYQEVMGANPSHFSAGGAGKDKVAGMDTARLPVENVSWDDAVEFCRRLSARAEEQAAGRTYRLPTEAEWEYACRAGTTTPFCYGDKLSSDLANCNGRRPYGGAPEGPMLDHTVAVGSYPPNAWGVYDMHGNVWEWCQDRLQPYAQKFGPDPPPPDAGLGRVTRGGSWFFGAADCRSARRNFREHDSRSPYHGFRVACDPAAATSARHRPAP